MDLTVCLGEGNINHRTPAILSYTKEKKIGGYEDVTRGPTLEDSRRFPWGGDWDLENRKGAGVNTVNFTSFHLPVLHGWTLWDGFCFWCGFSISNYLLICLHNMSGTYFLLSDTLWVARWLWCCQMNGNNILLTIAPVHIYFLLCRKRFSSLSSWLYSMWNYNCLSSCLVHIVK